jgi:antitoxin HicB
MRKLIYNGRRMSGRRHTVLFEPADGDGYVVTCPALPGLVTEGDTLDEARAMARDAISGYLESLHNDGLPIPEDIKLSADPVKEEVEVALPEPA